MRTRTRTRTRTPTPTPTGTGTVKGGTGTKGKPICRPSVGGAARINSDVASYLVVLLAEQITVQLLHLFFLDFVKPKSLQSLILSMY